MENKDGSLAFKATLDIDDFNVSAEAMERHIKKVSSTTEQEAEKMDKSILDFAKNGANYIVSYLVAQGMNGLLQSIITTRGQFQQLEIAFETMLGSGTKAHILMNQLTETAAKTPFDLQSIASSAKQLMAYGVASEQVNDTLIRLGNIASGLSLPLQDLAWLYGTTLTQGRLYAEDLNQFTGRGIPMIKELANIMGVAENQVKSLVSEGKVGFPEVQQVIQNLTNEGGMFFNLMEKQSQSLTGMISNLGDAWDSALNKFGKENQDIFTTGIQGAITLVEHLDDIVRIIKAITIAYGSYKAAIVLNTVAIKGYTGIALIDNTVRQAKIALMSTEIAKTKSLTTVTRALWATMKANPIGWLVSLVGLAVSAFTLFKDKGDEVKENQIGLARATKNASEEFSTQAGKVDALQKIINDSNKSYNARNEALTKLKDIIPDYNAQLSQEGELINNNTIAIKEYLSNLEKQIKLKSAQDELEQAYAKKRLLEKEKANREEQVSKAQAQLNAAQFSATVNSQRLGTPGMQNLSKGLDVGTKSAQDALNKANKDLKETTDNLNDINIAIEELNNEISTTSISVDNNTTKIRSYNEQVADTKKRINELTLEISKLRSGSIVKDNLAAEIEVKTNELNKAKGELELLLGKKSNNTIKSTENANSLKKSISEQIQYQKEQYALYYKWVETVGKDVANVKFSELIKNGNSFSEWIDSQLNKLELKAKSVENLSTDDQEWMFALSDQKNELSQKKSAMDIFRESIEQTINQAATLASKLTAIAEVKEKLEKGEFNLNPDQTLQAQYELDSIDRSAQKELNQSILNDFKSYEERKNEILANFSAMRLSDVAQNNTELLQRINDGEKAALSALEAEQLQASTDWKNLFANLDSLTVSEIQKLITNIENQISGADLKLNPIDYQALTESLNKAKDKLVELNPFTALGKAFDNYISATQKLKKAEEDNLSSEQIQALERQIKTSAKQMTASIQSINQVVGAVGSSVSSLLSSFGNSDLAETIGSVTDVLGGAGQTAMGVGQIMSGDLLGGITSVVGGITSVIGAFNQMHDKKKEKQIQALQDEVDKLSDAYDNLGDSINRAYSTDKASMIEQQNELLKQENDKIRQQIQAEKDKKDTDWDRIKEWENQIAENEKEIAENEKYNIIDAINGTDIMSAIDEFANAYADAWSAGEKAASKSADTVKNIIKTAIIEQLKNKLKPEVEAFMTYLSEALKDGVISDSEEKLIEQYEKKLEEISDKYLSQNEKWLYDESENQEIDTDPLSGAVRSMSEETGGVIAGRMNAFVINQSDQIEIMRSSLVYQAEIATNTRISAERLTGIETTLKRIESKDNSLLSQGIS